MKKMFIRIQFIFLFISFLVPVSMLAQNSRQKVFTTDIDHFWEAFDSIQQTKETAQKIKFINELYIQKGTEGLKSFMKVRGHTDSMWVNLIKQYPKFWKSIRPNTLKVKEKMADIEKSIETLQKIYPNLKEAAIYFSIGGINTGGTVDSNRVLIGTEIATGDITTDVSEFQSTFLKSVFSKQSLQNIVVVNVHEYIHTQQKEGGENLLGECIREGACDFITEIILNKPLVSPYIIYGNSHLDSLKESFKNEMFTKYYSNWLYNGTKKNEKADLGYFMGYAICKAYYQQATNKQKAVQDIIELNYAKEATVENFLKKSKFYATPINKKELIAKYQAQQPVLVSIDPPINGSMDVDPGITEITLNFSAEMLPKPFSIFSSTKSNYSYPIARIPNAVQLTDNNRSFKLKLSLAPDKKYEFIIPDGGYTSKTDYPLKGSTTITFHTKKL